MREDTAERVRGSYGFRRDRFAAWLDDGTTGRSRSARATTSGCAASSLNAERAAVQELRRSGEISDEVARRVERDLDLEDARLEI